MPNNTHGQVFRAKNHEKAVNIIKSNNFIELTDMQSNSKMLINKNHIVNIWETGNNCGINTVIHYDGYNFRVKESYETVKELLNA